MGLLNFDYEDNPLKLGLLMAGIQMATQGRQAAGPGFVQGFQTGLLGKRSRKSNEIEQVKLQRELERQKRLEGLDINSPDAVNQLMRAGQSPLAQSLLERGNLQSTREALDASGNPIWMGVTRGGKVNALGMPLPKVGEGQVITSGRSSLIPGYAGNKAFVAGQEEAAKQGQKYVDVPTESGDVPMRPDERRNILGVPGKPDYADIVASALKNGLFQTESGGNPNAVSPTGAVGLGQILPSTARNPGFGIPPLGDVTKATPQQNADFSTKYFAQMLRENNGDIQKALSAYTLGQGNVNKGASAPDYVSKVLSNAGASPPRILGQAEAAAQKVSAENTAKAISERAIDEPQATQRVRSVTQNLNRLDSAIDELSKDSGLSRITGTVAGRTPNFTNLATGAQAKLDSIKAQVFVAALQAMREASKTGGAVGNVSDREGDRLQDTIAALGQAQGTDDFKNQLTKARQQLQESKLIISDAYKAQYGKDIPQDDTDIPPGWKVTRKP